MKKKRVSVTKESQTGRNEQFIDNITGEKMSRVKFVHKIKHGEYKIITEENFLYLEEKNGKIFARLKN